MDKNIKLYLLIYISLSQTTFIYFKKSKDFKSNFNFNNITFSNYFIFKYYNIKKYNKV